MEIEAGSASIATAIDLNFPPFPINCLVRLENEPPRRLTHQKRWPIRCVVSSVDEDCTTAEEI